MASGPYWDPRRGTWSVQYWDGHWRRVVVVKKKPGWKPGGRDPKKPPPEAEAKLHEYAKVEAEAKARRKKKLPGGLSEFLDERLAMYKNANTIATVKVVYDQFLAWCKGRKIEGFAQVDSDACGEWIEEQEKKHRYLTVKRKLAIMKAAWRRVCKRKKILNPWDDVELHGKEPKRKRGSWTKDEFRRLVKVCRPWLQDLLIVGVNTGLRIGALMTLEWDHVRWSNFKEEGYGWVEVAEARAKGNEYEVPMSEELHKVLSRRNITHGGKFVLYGQNRLPIRKRSTTGQAISRACRRAGLPRPDSPNHHMRRTFARWAHSGDLTGQPVPLYIVSQWLGHSSVTTTQRYLGLKEGDSTRFMLPYGRNDAIVEPDPAKRGDDEAKGGDAQSSSSS